MFAQHGQDLPCRADFDQLVAVENGKTLPPIALAFFYQAAGKTAGTVHVTDFFALFRARK